MLCKWHTSHMPSVWVLWMNITPDRSSNSEIPVKKKTCDQECDSPFKSITLSITHVKRIYWIKTSARGKWFDEATNSQNKALKKYMQYNYRAIRRINVFIKKEGTLLGTYQFFFSRVYTLWVSTEALGPRKYRRSCHYHLLLNRRSTDTWLLCDKIYPIRFLYRFLPLQENLAERNNAFRKAFTCNKDSL